MKEILLYFLSGFALALALAPFVIIALRRLKAGQEILKHVDWHKSKSGTPTMGGVIFILPLVILAFFLLGHDTPLTNIAVFASISYAVVGFLDDYLKIKRHDNLGLRAYQKIIGQGGIAVLVGIFYYMANPDGRIIVPFANVTWDIGFWIMPLTVLVLIATTNAVNLTDGVDGLAGSVSLIYFAALAALIILVSHIMPSALPESEWRTLVIICAVMAGAILCYLLFNTNKARVFMGDTGSLFLGGMVGALSMFSFMGFFIVILGVMYVVSALSVVIQVGYFKISHGKRVFLIAPYHHHLEKKGWAEARIVALYMAVTILAGVVCTLSLL